MKIDIKSEPSVLDFQNGKPVVVIIYLLILSTKHKYQLKTAKPLSLLEAKSIKDKIIKRGFVKLSNWTRIEYG
ncbi:hypothetical protein [Photobacterium leiognathi]|uniref:hypothetical protein n=1 Tax=Photobacterium leiognathi TaxID=553611 RepID=UPI00298140D4|nr:hypothetical protein [Photobacterium leiognathi]